MAVPTYIDVKTAPPTTVRIGLGFRFDGWLRDVNGNGILSAPIDLYVDGVKVDEASTSGVSPYWYGYWIFWLGVPPPAGETHTVHVEFHGDGTYEPCASPIYDVYATAIPTHINIITAPPTTVRIGERFEFRGQVRDVYENPLGFVPINLYVDGVKVDEYEADSGGRYWFFLSLPPPAGETHTVHAEFPGDETYAPSSSPIYDVYATAIPTHITVTSAPPATVYMGESFPFSGALFDMDGNLLENKPIELYVDGVLVATRTTEHYGAWSFDVLISTEGTHTVHAEFHGDDTYEPCSSPIYDVYVTRILTCIDINVPSLDVGVGEPFYAWGSLYECPPIKTPPGLLEKTVELYVDGAKVRAERTGYQFELPRVPGQFRFVVPAFQTLGAHTVVVRFPGDDTYESSLGFIELSARASEVVPTIKNVSLPTKVASWESWTGYFHLCNCGTGAGNVRAVIQGDVDGETPIITMRPGDCQTIAIGGVGPARFIIRTGV